MKLELHGLQLYGRKKFRVLYKSKRVYQMIKTLKVRIKLLGF